jgi:hypothetical protein
VALVGSAQMVRINSDTSSGSGAHALKTSPILVSTYCHVPSKAITVRGLDAHRAVRRRGSHIIQSLVRVIRVRGERTDTYCDSCEVQTEFLYVM